MGFSIVVRLQFGRYDAATLDPSVGEWPPHPARVYCALVASATEPADWAALEWLERAGIPEVWCAEETAIARSVGYVVINGLSEKQGSQTWPGRNNGQRRRVSVLPSDDTFALVWPQAEPDDQTLARLARLVGQVPYVGRSTSWAEVTVTPRVIERRPGWDVFRTVPLGTAGSVPLRVPFPGYLAELRQAYEDGNRAWHVAARTIAYAQPTEVSATALAPLAGPYSDLLIWGVRRPSVPVGGDDLLTVTAALRRAVLSRVADPVPGEVSGHGADGRPHVAYLGLLDVAHAHADGRVLGVGVAVPRSMARASRLALLRGLLGLDGESPMSELRDGRGRNLSLSYEPDSPTRWGLREERWRTRAGSRNWITVTPLMPDRFPKRSADLAGAVAASVVTAGYPEPAVVEPLSAPAIRGAIMRPRRGTLPDRPTRRPLVHCRLRFAQPVRGPVLAGSLRYLGFGLFAPEVTDADA